MHSGLSVFMRPRPARGDAGADPRLVFEQQIFVLRMGFTAHPAFLEMIFRVPRNKNNA
jgi:hypothetical protein